MENQEPAKWREGIDPFSLPLRTVQIQQIQGYPHAANQVFYVKGICDGAEEYCYIKYAHHQDANLQNEVAILRAISSPFAPKVMECDETQFRYVVTKQISGKRLSIILADAGLETAEGYLYEYGQTLAHLHLTKGIFDKAPHRRFHDIPDQLYFSENDLEDVGHWLIENQPSKVNECFIHGDFHYANILWKNGHISGILDFELAGIGNREFDIAWSLILRPGQNFLKTEEEQREFLAGYHAVAACDDSLVLYYLVLIYTRFLKFGDPSYEAYVRRWLKAAISHQKRF